jgi:hypothetical protein
VAVVALVLPEAQRQQLEERRGQCNHIWNSTPGIAPFDSGPAAVIPEKSGIRKIFGIGELSFGQTFRIPPCAGKTISGGFANPMRLLRRR